MFLLSESRAEFEVRRDDKCSPFDRPKILTGRLCHPLFRLLVETRPTFLEDLY